MKGQNNKNLGVYSIALAAILWSTAGVAFKYIQWHPIAIAGLRSLLASGVLLLYWIFTKGGQNPLMTSFLEGAQKQEVQEVHQRRTGAYFEVSEARTLVQRRRNSQFFSVLGCLPPLPTKRKLLGAANYAVMVFLFIAANKLTTAANAILLQFTSPIWVMIFAAIFLKDKIKKIDILTVGCVLVGMSLFFIGKIQPGTVLGNLFAILSGVTMAIMVVSLKGVKIGSPLEIILWGNLLTAIVALPFYHTITFTTESLLAISFLGIVQLGLSYILYARGIAAVTALEGILFSVLEPLLNPLWVFFLIGEAPSPFSIIGGAIVILAILAGSAFKHKVISV